MTCLRCAGIRGLILFALIAGCGMEPPSADDPGEGSVSALTGAPTALFVVGNTTLTAGDAAFKARLEAHGFAVTAKKDSTVVAADATGKTLIVVSSTVTSGSVAVNFRTSAVPLLTWESALLDDYHMTSTTAGSFGTQAGQTQVTMAVAAGDPMAGGLSGTATVVTAAEPFSWGKPAAGAVVVARLASDASKAVVFRYEKGQPMVGMTAPERRASLFLGDATASLLTSSGRALVDAAIEWTARVGRANGTACATSAGCGSGFCVDGVCCSSVCGACKACNLPGSAGMCLNLPAGTACAAASCSGTTLTLARTCNGAGSCAAGTSVSCQPFTCAANACRTTCAVDSDCAAGNVCVAGRCAARKPLGTTCATSAECGSGFCVDGVCCSSICGACKACNLPGSAGMCLNLAAGTVCAAASCSGTTLMPAPTCNGAGSCTAGTPVSCQPFTCVANACRTTCAVDSDCAAGNICLAGRCAVRKPLGAACATSAECASGFCVGGICASSP